jgi:hypothetical protein
MSLIRILARHWMPPALVRSLPATRRDRIRFAGPFASWEDATAQPTSGGSPATLTLQQTGLLEAFADVPWGVEKQRHCVGGKPHSERSGYGSMSRSASPVRVGPLPYCFSVLQYLEDLLHSFTQLCAAGAQVIIVDKPNANTSSYGHIRMQQVPASIYRASYPCRSLSEPALLASFSPEYNLECAFDSTDAPPLARMHSQFRGYLLTSTGLSGGAR